MDVGTEINNQYRVVEHIGRGGMADVWSARDTRLNRMVAIKTIAHGLSGDTDPVALFKGEAQTIARLEHPHILPIYDFGEYQGQLYIVMRYVTGGSLEDLLSRGPLATNEVVRIGDAIAGALDYAHSNKVIHLDLKPPNILLDSHGTPYLADFGLATVVDREGRARNPGAGTLLYMAPEQVTAEVLDQRADVYSFAVMLYHMFTGQLPFDATTSLALKQLQFQEEIPDVERLSPSLPLGVTGVLRRGTAVRVADRFTKASEMMKELSDVLADAAAEAMGLVGFGEGDDESMEMVADHVILSSDADLLEAAELYSRARHNWAHGRGRFMLGVSDFMLMNGYYMAAERHGLTIDESGQQMLLRGALEYDHEVDYWWNRLDDTNRRWVCLHAIRSPNAPTRIRALYRLETLPDAEPPQIPRLVAQALQVETNQEAKLAALQVLGTRAKLLKTAPSYDIQTEFRGRLLTTMTRIGITLRAPSVWQEAVYSPEIDLLVAQVALDQGMPAVADFAARTVGRMRSLTAVRHIARQQRAGLPGALRALALVRDEAPSLPDVVSSQGRVYAWAANTWRRLTDNPMRIVWRYVFALIGGWLAMGLHVLNVFRSESIFLQVRWGNTIAIGLVFGVLVGFVALFADEFPGRLRGFWSWWLRLIIGLALGTLFGIISWWSFSWFYLQLNLPLWNGALVFGGLGLALGYLLTSLFNLRSWIAVPLSAVLIFIPIYITFEVAWMGSPIPPFAFSDALLYYDTNEAVFAVAIPFSILVALGGHFPGLMADLRGLLKWARRRRAPARPSPIAVPAQPQVDFSGRDETAPGRPKPAAPTVAPGGAHGMATELDHQFGAPAADEADREDTDPRKSGVSEDYIKTSFAPPGKKIDLQTDLDVQNPDDDSEDE